MLERTILFVGESHSHALLAAVKKSWVAPENVEVEVHRLTKIKNGKLIGSLNFDDLLLLCAGLGPNDVVVSLIGGNQHSSVSLVQHDQKFDVMDVGPDETLMSGSEMVPRSAIASMFERGLRKNDAHRICQIGSSGNHHTIHIAAPPPKKDDAHILKRFESDFRAKGLLEKGVSPAGLRRKFWEIQNQVLRSILAEDGIALLSPPTGTVTEDGFLKPEYYADDATHANMEYGIKVLDQVMIYVANQFPLEKGAA